MSGLCAVPEGAHTRPFSHHTHAHTNTQTRPLAPPRPTPDPPCPYGHALSLSDAHFLHALPAGQAHQKKKKKKKSIHKKDSFFTRTPNPHTHTHTYTHTPPRLGRKARFHTHAHHARACAQIRLAHLPFVPRLCPLLTTTTTLSHPARCGGTHGVVIQGEKEGCCLVLGWVRREWCRAHAPTHEQLTHMHTHTPCKDVQRLRRVVYPTHFPRSATLRHSSSPHPLPSLLSLPFLERKPTPAHTICLS